MQKFDTRTFQGLILTLQDYWLARAAPLFNIGHGSRRGNSHPMTCLRAWGQNRWRLLMFSLLVADRCRYGENPNRLQHYYQFQVVIKPSPDNIQELYLGSLKELGMDPTITTSVSWKITGKTRRWVPGGWAGSVAERHGSDAVHLLPAGWWSGV
ncbi:glycine tRNA synthetase [Escherichia coli]|uniref:Glycine--tRNA ligase alpha subunit n=1 Tax=Escherichia coli TaxID=562 RepID=A0A485J862_ECOLX|nr:glycine tRNA synthetase [Escherichia coli]